MPQQTLDREQNSSSFTLSLESQPIPFQRGLLEKILNPPQDDVDKEQTCTIKCKSGIADK